MHEDPLIELVFSRVELLMTRGFEQVYIDPEIIILDRLKDDHFISVILSKKLDPTIEAWQGDPKNPWDMEWKDLEWDLKKEDPVATVQYRGYDPMTGAPVVGLKTLNS